MKKVVIFGFFLFLTNLVLGQNKNAETLTIKTKIYCDHCLKCESCGGNLNVALKKVWGLKKISINPQNHNIVVVYKPNKTNPEQIRKAIAQAGFDADEVKATAEAYSKLDACCKKK